MAYVIDDVGRKATFLQLGGSIRTVQEWKGFLNAFDKLFRCFAKDSYVVGIDENDLPFSAGDDDVHSALDHFRRVAES